MGLKDKVLKKIGYAIYGFIPYADLDILGALGFTGLPLVEQIEFRELSSFQKVLLVLLWVVPWFDLEWFKFLGLNPLGGSSGGEAKLDDAYWDSNSQSQGGRYANGNPVRADGGRPGGAGNPRRNPGGNSGRGKISGILSTILSAKLLLIGLVAIPLLLFVGGQTGYAQSVGDQVGFQFAGFNVEAPMDMVRQSAQTAKCLGDVACMREWRFNNTERPGSEEVGQEYSLEIEEYSVNDGYDLDIAYRNASSNVPVSFSVYNPRHGLKGIKARNVKYRIKILDSGVGGECSTGWTELDGRYSEQDGNILPGGYATPLQEPEELTLEECGLLQPALGIKNNVEFQVKYDYSSQATLYFEAMSAENMRSQGMRPEDKKSETARTPVQTYVNVESPVTYSEDTQQAIPFSVQLGFETDRDDIDYKVNPEDLTLIDSDETNISTASAAGCQGLEETSEENELRLSAQQREVIEQRQENQWFDSSTGPSPALCTMELEEPSSISRTGETLTMRIDANYTVRLTEEATGFRTYNGRCEEQGLECPLLVPQEEKEDAGSDVHLISKCDTSLRLDANNGCGIRQGDNNSDWTEINWINGGEDAARFSYDRKVERGEIAMLWGNAKERIETQLGNPDYVERLYEYQQDESERKMTSTSGIGWDENEFREVQDKPGLGFVAYDNDIQFIDIDYQICNNEENLENRYIDNGLTHRGELLYLLIEKADCQNRLENKYGFDWSECFVDNYSNYVQTVTGWNLVTEGQLIGDAPESCSSAKESIPQCSGVRGWDPIENEAVCVN